MFNLKTIHLIALTATATLLFSQSALATSVIESIGTGSAGSYNHGEPKVEGSKSKKTPHHISGNARHHNPKGSSSKKSYSIHGKKGYSHKKSEGSQSKPHSYGKSGHVKSSHGYKGGYGKSYGHKKGSHGGHGKSPFKHVMDYKHKLSLTDVQIETMKELDVDFKKKIIQAKADHQIAHIELDLQVHSGKVNETKIRAAGAKIVASKTNKIMAMIDAKIQLLNILTTDQRYKMAKMH